MCFHLAISRRCATAYFSSNSSVVAWYSLDVHGNAMLRHTCIVCCSNPTCTLSIALSNGSECAWLCCASVLEISSCLYVPCVCVVRIWQPMLHNNNTNGIWYGCCTATVRIRLCVAPLLSFSSILDKWLCFLVGKRQLHMHRHKRHWHHCQRAHWHFMERIYLSTYISTVKKKTHKWGDIYMLNARIRNDNNTVRVWYLVWWRLCVVVYFVLI